MATVGLVLFALGPGAATVAADSAGNDSLDVSVSQAGNTGPTVTVTDNDTAVENATVTVELLDNGTYVGADGEYSTDADGTVTLPEPEENVSVEVTATRGDATGSTTAELTVSGENDTAVFGERVSSFVQSLLSNNTTGIGQQVAQFATENNPGNAPEWAGPPEDGDRGPPEHAGQDDADKRGGPPERAGQDDADKRGGPPEHAGQDDNETAENDSDTGGGPPEDAGPSDDSDDAEKSGGNGGGPPEQARGNGN